ncbi:MAG: cohesin domain-containing protein [Acidobacteriota bacterium]|nr:cohesin domain-containing protein [Acidobacteriota bacterium]
MKQLLLISSIMLAGISSGYGDTISLTPASLSVEAGQTFTLDADISQVAHLYDYQFSLAYNPLVLAAENITEGALFAETGDSFFLPGAINNKAGTIGLTYDTLQHQVSGVTGPGTLASIEFEAIGTGTSLIEFSPLEDLILEDSHGNVLPVTAQSALVSTVIPEPVPSVMLGLAFGLLWIGRRRAISAKGPRI